MTRKTTPSAPLECSACGTFNKSIFCRLSELELDGLDNEKRIIQFKKGETIFKERGFPNGLYCIHSGKVKLHKLGEEGREQIVRLAGPSNILGYRALLEDGAYSASATALEASEICYFPKAIFMEVLKTNSPLALKLIKILTENLRMAENRMTSLTQKQTKERIAEALLILKSNFGVNDDNVINAILTRHDIGNIAGTTTETTIRVLSNFNKEHIIKLDGKQIKILDIDALKTISNAVK